MQEPGFPAPPPGLLGADAIVKLQGMGNATIAGGKLLQGRAMYGSGTAVPMTTGVVKAAEERGALRTRKADAARATAASSPTTLPLREGRR